MVKRETPKEIARRLGFLDSGQTKEEISTDSASWDYGDDDDDEEPERDT